MYYPVLWRINIVKQYHALDSLVMFSPMLLIFLSLFLSIVSYCCYNLVIVCMLLLTRHPPHPRFQFLLIIFCCSLGLLCQVLQLLVCGQSLNFKSVDVLGCHFYLQGKRDSKNLDEVYFGTVLFPPNIYTCKLKNNYHASPKT